MNAVRTIRSAAALAAVAVALALISPLSAARANPEAIPLVPLAALPAEAQSVYALILAGGPFRYDRDGIAFGNREALLPAKPRGYYHEYTVHTPGTKNRGARRIICGGPARSPDACYYTDDHYRSFRRISE
jgi:ribonuclease T1